MAVCDRLRPSGRHLAGRLDLASPGDDKVGADGKDKPRVRASPNSLAPPNQALIVPSSVAKIKKAGPEFAIFGDFKVGRADVSDDAGRRAKGPRRAARCRWY